KPAETALTVIDRGQRVPLDLRRLQTLIESACAGLGADVKPDPIMAETKRNLYDGVPIDEVHKAAILAARTLIEKDPGYTRATARLLLHTIRREILGEELLQSDMAARYAEYFPQFVKKGVAAELLDEKLLHYDLGRLGNDWTNVRALGSYIKGTNGMSQGVVPFLKVVNDTAVAVNQGGKRKGAVCAYLESWHLDIEEFLELRKNTGDDRRRTHDMNT